MKTLGATTKELCVLSKGIDFLAGHKVKKTLHFLLSAAFPPQIPCTCLPIPPKSHHLHCIPL